MRNRIVRDNAANVAMLATAAEKSAAIPTAPPVRRSSSRTIKSHDTPSETSSPAEETPGTPPSPTRVTPAIIDRNKGPRGRPKSDDWYSHELEPGVVRYSHRW